MGRFPSAGKFLQAQGIPISVQKRSASLPVFESSLLESRAAAAAAATDDDDNGDDSRNLLVSVTNFCTEEKSKK